MALFAFALLGASPAWACPLCDSATGARVRAGLFDGDFGYHVLVMALPFPVFLAIVALIHFGWPWGEGRRGPTEYGTRGREPSLLPHEEVEP